MTQSCRPSGVIVVSPGTLYTGMVAMFVCATVSRTEMLADSELEINALSRSGVIAIRIGSLPTGMWVTTRLVAVLITATAWEYLAGIQMEGRRVCVICADCAKAEDANAERSRCNDRRTYF